MISLATIMKENDAYDLSTQYCPVNENFTSVICFFNYYGQVFPEQNPEVKLYLLFFNDRGEQIASVVESVPGGGFVQLDVRNYIKENIGIVCLVAVPICDVRKIAAEGVMLKKKFGTGFYIVWRDGNGNTDFMHEWIPVNSVKSIENSYFLTIDKSNFIKQHELVLMHSCYNEQSNQVSSPVVEIFHKNNNLFRFEIDPIEMMGLRVLDLEKMASNLGEWLESYDSLLVKVTSRYLSPPLTKETHLSGDFHIHHID